MAALLVLPGMATARTTTSPYIVVYNSGVGNVRTDTSTLEAQHGFTPTFDGLTPAQIVSKIRSDSTAYATSSNGFTFHNDWSTLCKAKESDLRRAGVRNISSVMGRSRALEQAAGGLRPRCSTL
jgi:hypothetical protein